MLLPLAAAPQTPPARALIANPRVVQTTEGDAPSFSLGERVAAALRPFTEGNRLHLWDSSVGPVLGKLLSNVGRNGEEKKLSRSEIKLLVDVQQLRFLTRDPDAPRETDLPGSILKLLQEIETPAASSPFTYSDQEFTSIQDFLTGYGNPFRGAIARDIEGVVTGIRYNRDKKMVGFYFQEGDSSATDRNGIYVYLGRDHNVTVQENQKIRLSGRIIDYRPPSIFDKNDTSHLLNVQIMPFQDGVVDLGMATKDEIPKSIDLSEVNFPPHLLHPDHKPATATDIEAENFPFDPEKDGLALLTTLKGQKVVIENAIVCGAASYGYVYVTSAKSIPPEAKTPDGGVRNILDKDGNPLYHVPVFRVRASAGLKEALLGDTIGRIEGVVDYSDGSFNIFTNQEFTITPSARSNQKIHFEEKANHLRLLSFNVEMQSFQDEKGLQELADKFKLAGSPELVGVEEWSDDSGGEDDSNTSAKNGYARFLEILKEKTGHEYMAISIDPENSMDGGKPGANIRNVIFKRKDVKGLEFIGVPGATADTRTTVISIKGEVKLSHNPGRIDPANPAFENSRKPLVAQFKYNERNVFMSVVHFKSKRGDAPLLGHIQPPTRPSEKHQAQQMRAVRQFMQGIQDLDPKAILITCGDLNADIDSSTINELGGKLMVDARQGVEAQTGQNDGGYTYVYEGRALNLDHIYLSAWLFANPLKRLVKLQTLLWNAHLPHGHPDRMSDHNAVMVQIYVPPE